MMNYSTLLDSMMNAILEGDTRSAPALLRGKPDFSPEAQLAVYTEGYRLRLKGAIESTYPALLYYLGPQAFAGLAEGFITAQPSRHFNLDKYTIGFGAYVAVACEDRFARELAQLESAIHDVYQREETPAMDAGWAQNQTPEALSVAKLLPRAAACLLELTWPVNEYFTAFRAEKKPAKPALQKSWLLVLRHRHQVRRLALEEAECTLLGLLADGMSLAQTFDDSRMEPYLQDAQFAAHLQIWLARWIGEGILRQPA